MSEAIYFPRLDIYRASKEWVDAKDFSLSRITELMGAVNLDTAEFYHAAGRRASATDIQRLRNDIVGIAREHGFPRQSQGRRDGGAQFDRAVGETIRKLCPLVPAEAARVDVWNFINVRVLLDVVVWRWGTWRAEENEWSVSQDRLFQLARTAFGRLWWRVELLGPEAASLLSEDQSVQLMERPRMTGYPPLARAIADRLIVDQSGVNKDDLLRVAIRRLGRRMAVTSIFLMNGDQLAALVDQQFAEGAQALKA